MKNFIFFNLFFLIIISGCKPIILKMFGFSEPKVENEKSVKKYLTDLNQDTTDVFTMDTLLFRDLKSKPAKPGMAPSYRPIQLRIYDKNGKPLAHWISCEGFIDDMPLFSAVPPVNSNSLDTTLMLQDDLNRYCDFNGNKKSIIIPQGFDYYFVIHFAKYFHGMNKETFKAIEKYQKLHPGLKFKFFMVNNDFQEFWGIEPIVTMDIN